MPSQCGAPGGKKLARELLGSPEANPVLGLRGVRLCLQKPDFFLTQPIYDPAKARIFLDDYASEHGALGRPILVGILPLVSAKHAHFLHNEVPGIVIPEETRLRMERAGGDAGAEGVRLAVELIRQVKPWAGGVYIMPQFHRYDLVADIIEAVK